MINDLIVFVIDMIALVCDSLSSLDNNLNVLPMLYHLPYTLMTK